MKHILILLLLCPLFALSQTKAQPDTIKIPTHAAKSIVRDLVSYDSLKAVHKLTVEELVLVNRKVDLQAGIIKSHEQKGLLYEDRIANEQEKYKVQGKWVEDLRKDNKNLKTELRIVKTAGTIVIGGLLYLLLAK